MHIFVVASFDGGPLEPSRVCLRANRGRPKCFGRPVESQPIQVGTYGSNDQSADVPSDDVVRLVAAVITGWLRLSRLAPVLTTHGPREE